MIIKIATGKDENGNIKWTHLYSAAIRNRLRRDLNLADVPDPAEARKNLGIEAYVIEVTDDLYNRLKQYIDKQDIYYDTTLRTYIANNIETELKAHAERLDEIENTMVTKDAFDSYFQVSWDKRVPALKKELQDYSDVNRVKAEAHSDENLNAAKKYTDDKISALDTALRSYIDSKVSALETEIGQVDTKVTKLTTRVNGMISNINKNFRDIEEDLNYIATAADKLISHLQECLGQATNVKLTALNSVTEAILLYITDQISVQNASARIQEQVSKMNKVVDPKTPSVGARNPYKRTSIN